jgi:hypothetical protein
MFLEKNFQLCHLNPASKTEKTKFSAEEHRNIIAAMSKIMMESRELFFPDEEDKGTLVFHVLWHFASLNRALYLADDGGDHAIIRCLFLAFIKVNYLNKLITKYPKIKTEKAKKSATDQLKSNKKKTSSEIVDYTYFHDFIVHIFFFLRTCSRPDITNENEERSWSLLKKWITNIRQNYAHKYVNVKEYCYNLRNSSVNKALNSVIPFFTDIGNGLFIPKEFVQGENGEYKDYFLFFIWHLADLDKSKLVFDQQRGGFKINAPLLKENDQTALLLNLTPDMSQTTFFEKMNQHFVEKKDDNFLLNKALSKKPVLFWKDQPDIQWFKSN